jgi:hypothetical protein
LKGYIDNLENRIYHLESMLQQILPLISVEQQNKIVASIPPIASRSRLRTNYSEVKDRFTHNIAPVPTASELHFRHDQQQNQQQQAAGEKEQRRCCIHEGQQSRYQAPAAWQQTLSPDIAPYNFSWPHITSLSLPHPDNSWHSIRYESTAGSEINFGLRSLDGSPVTQCSSW